MNEEETKDSEAVEGSPLAAPKEASIDAGGTVADDLFGEEVLNAKTYQALAESSGIKDKPPRAEQETRVPDPQDRLSTYMELDKEEIKQASSLRNRLEHLRNLQPGEFFGPYKIVRRLGSGGIGVVYGVEDPQKRGEVALKIYLAHIPGDPKIETGIQTAKKLSHPYIVPIMEDGTVNGVRYIVMPWCRRPDLKRRQRHFIRFTAKQIVALGRKLKGLVSAFAYLATLGIVHRDVKSSNIFTDSNGRIRLGDLDFATEGDDQPAGKFVGTSGYAAPEQVALAVQKKQKERFGETKEPSERITPKTDIFCLAVTLYELLTGVPVGTEKGTSTDAVIARLQFFEDIKEGRKRLVDIQKLPRYDLPSHTQGPELSMAAQAEMRIPSSLARFIMQGLSINPEERIPKDKTLSEVYNEVLDLAALEVEEGNKGEVPQTPEEAEDIAPEVLELMKYVRPRKGENSDLTKTAAA